MSSRTRLSIFKGSTLTIEATASPICRQKRDPGSVALGEACPCQRGLFPESSSPPPHATTGRVAAREKPHLTAWLQAPGVQGAGLPAVERVNSSLLGLDPQGHRQGARWEQKRAIGSTRRAPEVSVLPYGLGTAGARRAPAPPGPQAPVWKRELRLSGTSPKWGCAGKPQEWPPPGQPSAQSRRGLGVAPWHSQPPGRPSPSTCSPCVCSERSRHS